ncbi:MAG TPA: hypothetical protein VIT88_10540 [Pyrinomonadaceae bacterium]
MKTVKQVKREAKYLLRLCLVNGSLDEQRVRQVIQGVLTSKRRGYVALGNQFERLVRLERIRQSDEVQNATPLPDDVGQSVKASSVRMRGPRMNISFTKRQALISGKRIRAASY